MAFFNGLNYGISGIANTINTINTILENKNIQGFYEQNAKALIDMDGGREKHPDWYDKRYQDYLGTLYYVLKDSILKQIVEQVKQMPLESLPIGYDSYIHIKAAPPAQIVMPVSSSVSQSAPLAVTLPQTTVLQVVPTPVSQPAPLGVTSPPINNKTLLFIGGVFFFLLILGRKVKTESI